MRREIVAAVVSGLVLGGVTAIPAVAAVHGADMIVGSIKAQPAAHAEAKLVNARTAMVPTSEEKKTTAMKTVIYHGYEFRVRASWPVYRLDEHPTACVRYDINAVYLSTPGANERCPATVIGRTQTITVIPGVTIAARSGSEITYLRDQPDGVGGTRAGSLAAVHSTIIQNASQHELRVAIGAALLGITVLGTYGADPAVTEQVLHTLGPAPRGAADSAQSGSLAALSGTSASVAAQRTAAETASGAPADTPAEPSAASNPSSTSWPGLHDWPRHVIGQPTPFRAVNGFDTCTAPSLDAMRAWRRDYAVAGVYIGGENMGCYYGNLSASWLRATRGMGWGALPIYVGKQAPCTTAQSVTTIDLGQAAAQGSAAGWDAVGDARKFGIGTGSPIFYDMESYNTTNGSGCKTAVLTYLGAWDRVVSEAGYQTGVYSSRDSGIKDLQTATLAKLPGFTAPEGIWDAHWDGIRSLGDGLTAWPLADRIKQYAGIINQTIGGYALQIDRDLVGGPIAH
jgi:hypothetical protein